MAASCLTSVLPCIPAERNPAGPDPAPDWRALALEEVLRFPGDVRGDAKVIAFLRSRTAPTRDALPDGATLNA